MTEGTWFTAGDVEGLVKASRKRGQLDELEGLRDLLQYEPNLNTIRAAVEVRIASIGAGRG